MFLNALIATAAATTEAVTEAVTEAAAEAATTVTATTTALSGEVGGVGTWPIISWIADLFGIIMRGIYLMFSSMNIYSVTLCIVLFTVVTKMLLLPMTIKQQKFSRVQSLMSPELTAIQKKYQGRKDQASVSKMQAEQQAVYDKYGSSMSAGCLPSLIQLPFLFALYPVILYFGYYVPELLAETDEIKNDFFMLFGNIDLQATPWQSFSFETIFKDFSWLIPIIAGGLQFLSTKLTQSQTAAVSADNSAANSMKAMTYTMPLMTVFLGFTLPAFLGVYWVVQSLVMVIQQYVINKKLSKTPIEELIKANIEKQNKKRAKRGLPPISEKASINARKAGEQKAEKTAEELAQRNEGVKKSTEYYNSRSAAPGSLAAKANMVREYNEKHK